MAYWWRVHPSISVPGGQGSNLPPLPGAIYTGLLPLQIDTELLLHNLTDTTHPLYRALPLSLVAVFRGLDWDGNMTDGFHL
jgi:hypothetical protein